MNQNIQNTKELIKDYLRVLYSPSFSGQYIENTSLFEINLEDLALEQEARQRNLFSFLKMTNSQVFQVIDQRKIIMFSL